VKEVKNLPAGIKVFTDFLSLSEAEYMIDIAESASESDCGATWSIPSSHSPDISCFRGNSGINISEHGFYNAECNCGLKELDALLGKTMLRSLGEYNKQYDTFFTQDEGFVILKQEENHVDHIVVDENPFVNRLVSYSIALNVDGPIEYMNFNKFDFKVVLSKPSLVIYPSNFMYSYSKPYNEGLYEVLNYFNNNPAEEVFDQIFTDD